MPTARPAPRSRLPLAAADLRGLARLAVDATLGVADVVEAMHEAIAWQPLRRTLASAGRTRGITGLVYRTVRGATRGVGVGLDALLTTLPLRPAAPSPEREAFVAALNGVFGDHLADSGNPLAIPMALRIGGQPWASALRAPTPHLLVLVHGLAMNDLQWRHAGHDHGQALARELGLSPVYLHYNSGRHVSQNGREFADRLDELVAGWPVPVQSLAIVGHSMGGLVARSACHLGTGRPWRALLTHLVCLGTPHHGAPLERRGRQVEALLGASRYVAPLARLARARSAGITDLRFGNVQDADWQAHARHTQRHDDRTPTPLPAGVRTCFVAATTGERADDLRSTVLGDGLVPLASALGEHPERQRALRVPARQRLVITRADHWDLLSDPRVQVRLRTWLGEGRATR